MSVIGPRPGLWNQDLLTAERDKYGANDVKPGLTGWAQINGRDELEIPEKARLDGEYVQKMGLKMDAKCFLGSVHVFGKNRYDRSCYCNIDNSDYDRIYSHIILQKYARK